MLRSSVPAVYPSQAIARGIEGWVDLEFVVDRNGQPRNLAVVQASPPGRFDAAALAAVAQYRYVPFERDGRVYERRRTAPRALPDVVALRRAAVQPRGSLDSDSSHVLQPEPMPYGAWCSTDSTGPMSPRSILNTSAIAQVHGIFGPLSARSTVGQRAEARVAARVVEEREREREAALGIDDDEAPIANARDVEEHARAELLEAADSAGRSGGRERAGSRARGRRPTPMPFSSRAQSGASG